jgi:hypothetical protein
MNPTLSTSASPHQAYKITSQEDKSVSHVCMLDTFKSESKKINDFQYLKDFTHWRDNYLYRVCEVIVPIFQAVSQKTIMDREIWYCGLLCDRAMRRVNRKNINWYAQGRNATLEEKSGFPWEKNELFKKIALKGPDARDLRHKNTPLAYAQAVEEEYAKELINHPFTQDSPACFQDLLKSKLMDVEEDFLNLSKELDENRAKKIHSEYHFFKEQILQKYALCKTIPATKEAFEVVQQKINQCKVILNTQGIIDLTNVPNENLSQKIPELQTEMAKTPSSADIIKKMVLLIPIFKTLANNVKRDEAFIKTIESLDVNVNSIYRAFYAVKSNFKKVEWPALTKKAYEVAIKCFQLYPKLICDPQTFDLHADFDTLTDNDEPMNWDAWQEWQDNQPAKTYNACLSSLNNMCDHYNALMNTSRDILAKYTNPEEVSLNSNVDINKLINDYALEIPVFLALEQNDLRSFQNEINKLKPKIPNLFQSRPFRGYSLPHKAILHGINGCLKWMIEQDVNLLVQTLEKVSIPVKAGVDCLCLAAARGDYETLQIVIDALYNKMKNKPNDFTNMLKKALGCVIVPDNVIDRKHTIFGKYEKDLHQSWIKGADSSVKALLYPFADSKEHVKNMKTCLKDGKEWLLNLEQIKQHVESNNREILERYLKMGISLSSFLDNVDADILGKGCNIVENIQLSPDHSQFSLLEQLKKMIAPHKTPDSLSRKNSKPAETPFGFSLLQKILPLSPSTNTSRNIPRKESTGK